MVETLSFIFEQGEKMFGNKLLTDWGRFQMEKKIMCIGKVVKGHIIYLKADPEANGLRKKEVVK